MKWRKLVIATHRDLGYFFAGLTVIYAVSGVAVNHIDDWNPNYVLSQEHHELGELPANETADRLGALILERLNIDESPNAVVRMGPEELRVFLDQRTLFVGVPEGSVVDEKVRRRFALFQANYLHLNHGKGMWTWFADVYALGLLTLAGTGIFIISGKKGLGGRGRWLLLAGLVIPALFLISRL